MNGYLVRLPITTWPGWVIALWTAAAVTVGYWAPSLTRLAAEGQGKLLGKDAESQLAADGLSLAWPDQAYESLAVAAFYRADGLTANDIACAKRLRGGSRAETIPLQCYVYSGRTQRRISLNGYSAGTGQSYSWPLLCPRRLWLPQHMRQLPGFSRRCEQTSSTFPTVSLCAGWVMPSLARLYEQCPDVARSRRGGHCRTFARCPVRRLPLSLARSRSLGDDRGQPRDRAAPWPG